MKDKFCEIDDQTIRYWEIGLPIYHTVVLVHGTGAAVESWGSLPLELSQSFHVVALDLPGFGKSEKSDILYTPELMLQLFERFCLKKGLENFSIIGHSLGGGIALGYAVTRSNNVANLILLASGGLGNVSFWFRLLSSPFSERFILPLVGNDWIGPKIFKFFYGRGVSRESLNQLSAHWDDPGIIRTFVRLMRSVGVGQKDQLVECLHEVTCPVLVIWGTHDLVLSVNHVNVIRERIPHSILLHFLIKTNLSTSNCVYDCFMQHRLPVC